MSKITKTTYKCDFCHKESIDKGFVRNFISMSPRYGVCVEKKPHLEFEGDLCDICHVHVVVFLKQGKT